MTAVQISVTPEAYHADPCPTPSLSYSTAATLINESPRAAHYYHPRLGGHAKKSTSGMRLGSLADALLLGGAHRVKELPFDAWRSNEAKAAKAEAEADGLIPCKSQELDEALKLVTQIKTLLREDFRIELTGLNQVQLTWEEESVSENGQRSPVLCRGMLDHWLEESATILDLKCTTARQLKRIQSTSVDFGYDIQAAAYLSAVNHRKPERVGRVLFVDLHVVIGPPVDLVPILACHSLIDLGEMRWRRAVDTWAECMRTGHWPGIADHKILPGEAPAYAMQREQEIQEYGTDI